MVKRGTSLTQFQKPTGQLGRRTLEGMNKYHSKLTDWGLTHVSAKRRYTILDVGCGGGRTINKLAAIATQGKVYGVDYSEQSVAVSEKTNAAAIRAGLVEIRNASVSKLPFPEDTFDLVTAVETHFWWSDLAKGMHEVFRVTKRAGIFIVIAEVYKGATSAVSRSTEKQAPQTGITMLTPEEHRELFRNAGFTKIELDVFAEKGWICVIGRKP
jgi:SAM-dependent methyltransferase